MLHHLFKALRACKTKADGDLETNNYAKINLIDSVITLNILTFLTNWIHFPEKDKEASMLLKNAKYVNTDTREKLYHCTIFFLEKLNASSFQIDLLRNL